MLKTLATEYAGRQVILECTHKRAFPPPQMYGFTPDDIDVLWRQGKIAQAEFQLLKTWQRHCGLMVMGPKCLDCPLARKKTPRPGRPQVFDVDPWLPIKERYAWEDMAKKAPLPSAVPSLPIEVQVAEGCVTHEITDDLSTVIKQGYASEAMGADGGEE